MAAEAIPIEVGTVFGGIFGLFFLIWLGFIVIGILGTIFWIFMIVDAAKRNYKNENDKIMWILIVVLANIVGAIVYYFVVKKKDKK